MRTFAELETALSARTNYELQSPPPGGWGLERMLALLAALGNPERAYGVVHIAGTAGKGTTAAALASTLDAAGLRVGLTTSPHLCHLRERIRIGAGPASPAVWLGAAERTLTAAQTLSAAPTYFELVTAMAFEAFRSAEVDLAVVETGLGGRLDATNVVARPLLSMVTHVACDHTALLGQTLGEIAREKAGIIKGSAPVVAAPGSTEAEQAIAKRCEQLGSPLWLLGRDAHVRAVPRAAPNPFTGPAESPSVPAVRPARSLPSLDTEFRVETPWRNHTLRASLPPALAANLGLVTVAAHLLEESLERPVASSLDLGLQRLSWRGRFDVIGGTPDVVIDGAHESASMSALVATHQDLLQGPAPVILFGIAQDKNLDEVLTSLAPLTGRVVRRSLSGPRATPSQSLANAFAARGWVSSAAPSVEAGLAQACQEALTRGSHVLVAGSLHLAGGVLSALGQSTDRAWT